MSKATRQKQRIWLIIAFLIVGYAASKYSPQKAYQNSDIISVEQAFQQKKSDVQLHVEGTVIKILADDLDGNRHQKFIIERPQGLTILVAHNIDLASRINSLKLGDKLTLYGEYEWSKKGGILHWTHHDPAGQHVDGWIEHQGQRYQ